MPLPSERTMNGMVGQALGKGEQFCRLREGCKEGSVGSVSRSDGLECRIQKGGEDMKILVEAFRPRFDCLTVSAHLLE